MMPREKLLFYGAESLLDYELLAIFLRTGIKDKSVITLSQSLILEFGSLYELMNANEEEFCSKKGLGVAKYCQLKSVIELSKRYLKNKIKSIKLDLPEQCFLNYIKSIFINKQHEMFLVVFLTSDKRIIDDEILFNGSTHCVNIYPREIIKKAIQFNASFLILAHNHPTGKTEPSIADIEMTYKIIESCTIFDIKVLDHYIISNNELISFKEKGLI